jgi:hypothetical protein
MLRNLIFRFSGGHNDKELSVFLDADESTYNIN